MEFVLFITSTLSFNSAANAINFNVSNSVFDSVAPSSSNIGQSFINDPSGTGNTILLNTWTVGFSNSASQITAVGQPLTIYSGSGNGGAIIGVSSSASTLTFAGLPAVQWLFPGGLALTDNSVYTSFLAPSLDYPTSSFSNAYTNGDATVGSAAIPGSDLIFQGVFSVPFEFSPSFGLATLGGLWLSRQLIKRVLNAKLKC